MCAHIALWKRPDQVKVKKGIKSTRIYTFKIRYCWSLNYVDFFTYTHSSRYSTEFKFHKDVIPKVYTPEQVKKI